MKKLLIITLCFFLTQLSFGQTTEELMEMWNADISRIGNENSDRIDSSLKNVTPKEIILSSSNYSDGLLKTFRQNETIVKLEKSFKIDTVQYTENYYFNGRWPVFVSTKKSSESKSNRFYFDKTNLMLWIDSDDKLLTVENEVCNDWWWHLLESMDKLKMIADMNQTSINEDLVKLPESPPMSKEDSLKFESLNKQVEELLKSDTDSIKEK